MVQREDKFQNLLIKDDIKIGTIRICSEEKSASLRQEGDVWYDITNHVLKYRDNVGVKTVTASP